MSKIKVGDKAPPFTLPSQTGENITLSKFFGKKNIVLYFYPKDESGDAQGRRVPLETTTKSSRIWEQR